MWVVIRKGCLFSKIYPIPVIASHCNMLLVIFNISGNHFSNAEAELSTIVPAPSAIDRTISPLEDPTVPNI